MFQLFHRPGRVHEAASVKFEEIKFLPLYDPAIRQSWPAD